MKTELLKFTGKLIFIIIKIFKKNTPRLNIVAVGGTEKEINVHREPSVYFNIINNYYNTQEF